MLPEKMTPTPDKPAEERIGKYRVHPVASLFPLLEGQAFDDLVEDIEVFGQRVPIVVDGDVLLDGRNRLRACLQLDIAPVVEVYKPRPNEDPGSWIISLNIERRSLTPEMRLAILAQAESLMSAMRREANERRQAARTAQGHHGIEGGRGHKKDSNMDSYSRVPKRDTVQMNARSTAGQLAAKAGVSQHKAAQAIAVRKHAPELLEEVKTGRMKLRDAARKVERQERPKKPKLFDLEKVLRREVTHFEKVRDSLPGDMQGKFVREFIRTLEKL